MALTEAQIYARAALATLDELRNEVAKRERFVSAGDKIELGKQEERAEVLNMIECRMDRYTRTKR